LLKIKTLYTMKTYSYIFALACLVLVACKEKVPNHHIEYEGKYYREPNPVQYDSNGDGKIDPTDDVIEVLGNSLNVSQAPGGKPLYTTNETITPPGSTTGSGSLVPTGERMCYHDLQRNCDKYGALYAYETTVNTDKAQMKQISESQKIDADNDGVLDYINTLRNTTIDEMVDKYYGDAAIEAEMLIEEATNKQISSLLLQSYIQEAIRTALQEVLYEHNDFVDIALIQQKVNVAVAQAIIDAVADANLSSYISEEDLDEIAFAISQPLAVSISNDIAKQVSNSIITEYKQMIQSGSMEFVQGICPDGYYIPSDVDWMIFELALGMSAQDLTKYGETVTDRGASAKVPQAMVEDHGFEYGGYMSINGTFAQLGEAGVYWSSSIGTDELGDYVWVRQIDTSYTGVLRYKHYEKTGLSIRCFKKP